MTTAATPADFAAALIAEARRRANRRRLVGVVLALALALGLLALLAVHRGGAVSTGRPFPTANGPLTIIHSGIRAVGGGTLGADLWPCGPAHRCWEIESLAWNPDGRRLAFGGVSIGGAGSYDGLHIVDVVAGTTAIVRSLQATERDWLDLAWAPDGRRLAFVSNWTIFLIGADGSGFRVLHTGTEGHDRAPTWSHDGTRIAYQTKVGAEERVYTIALDGSHRNVVARNAAWPAWSPDGSAIAYRACGGIRLASPSGRDLTPRSASGCTHIGVDGAPVWSPDGRKIAMGVSFGTYTMNADGSGLTRVGGPPDNAAQPEVREAWLRPSWRPAAVSAVAPATRFPTGRFLTKIATSDLYRAGWRDYNDAHWETLTFRKDGTWRDVVFHPTIADQPPVSGRYVVTGDRLRLLGTPDVLRWRYANGQLTLAIVHVPDKLGRIVYTAHPWRKIG